MENGNEEMRNGNEKMRLSLGELVHASQKPCVYCPWFLVASGDSTLPSNYHPISSLAILSKERERHVFSLIQEELNLSDHPAFHQWGIRSGHSTSSALTIVINDWLKSMELGKPLCSVFLMFGKHSTLYPTQHLSINYSLVD